ncbi:MAG: cupin domain-containing protein [Verrucomicrobiota bacterium]
MDPRFDKIASHPSNSIFQIVFFPDRIYHAQYLNATRSPRYRYNVREVRSKGDTTVLKGEVFLDDRRLCNFLRIEYRASRLVEAVRERQRFVRDGCVAWVKLLPRDPAKGAEARVKLGYCPWIDAFQVEVWETLEAPENLRHDLKVLDMMGRDGEIVRVPAFNAALADIESLDTLEMAFRENTEYLPFGYTVPDGPGQFDAAWDTYYERNIQVPKTQDPSSDQNTVSVNNYRIDFQRGWFITDAHQVAPVRYRNAMMNSENPDRDEQNVIEMRWILQQELGSELVFFHEVTIPPFTVEGTHQHIGSEELYYIVEGEGVAYMGANDDPSLAQSPLVKRDIFGLEPKDCRSVAVKPGSVIYTKSGGIHGIENPTDKPLRFVAFLYHST